MELSAQLELIDWGVLAAYFIILVIVGVWSSFSNRGNMGGYFLGGRNMHWIPIGASLFASNIGSGHFIGIAGNGASKGISAIAFEFNAIFVLLILGWLFVPVYVSSGVFTMPEYLKFRFGGRRIQMFLSALALLLYVFTKISADLYAGAVFIERAASLPLWPSVIILLAVSGVFTVLGGLSAVIWTDFAQTIIMLAGAAILSAVSIMKAGGPAAIFDLYNTAVPNTTKMGALLNMDTLLGITTPPDTLLGNVIVSNLTNDSIKSIKTYGACGEADPYALHIFRPLSDETYPWLGILVGSVISSVWYWCSDQVIVQRTLAAKNLLNAKLGCVLAGYLKVLPMLLILMPGMAARILFPDFVGCSEPEVCKKFCNKEGGCSDFAYPTLLIQLLPIGLRGVMLAVALSALVSSLTSVFNSASSIFTMDFWRFIRKQSGDMELMIVGRVFIVVLAIFSVAWIPIVQRGGELFTYIQNVTAFIAPPVCAVYVLALFWPRINEAGAFWALIFGFILGMARFMLDLIFEGPGCGQEDGRPFIVKLAVPLHFGIFLFVFSIIVAVSFSYATVPIPKKFLHRITFWTRFSEENREDIASYSSTINACGCARKGIVEPQAEVSIVKANEKGELELTPGPQMPPDYEEPKPKLPLWKTVIFFVCGIENLDNKQGSQAVEPVSRLLELIHETPTQKLLGFTNLLIIASIALGLYIYFF